MGRSKLDKFRDNDRNPHIIQPGKDIFNRVKGHWGDQVFCNENPIVVELACGRGEYTIGMARKFPEKNFIGVDIKGPRIWQGGKIAVEENLNNVAFLRVMIQNIEEHIAENELDEIWITFPDPRPKKSDERRRLTHPRFIKVYKKLLKTGGRIHLKTDNTDLFRYSLEKLSGQTCIEDLQFTFNLYGSDLLIWHHGIKTNYELKYLEEGTSIKYLNCLIK